MYLCELWGIIVTCVYLWQDLVVKVHVKWQMFEAEETIPIVILFVYIGQFITWYVQIDKRKIQNTMCCSILHKPKHLFHSQGNILFRNSERF
jgi:hypothetical protein